MKSASRRQVRTPIGKKTKRGAELEGTPKTPKSLEASPGRSACMDGSAQEPDDRRIQLRTRRPLQWNNIPKPGTLDDGDMRGENTLSPHQQQAQLKCTGESNAVSALSPICVNAIHVNSGQQGAGRKTGIKKPNELPPSVLSPSIKDCANNRKALDTGDPHASKDYEDDAASTDAGSCPSSPDLPSSRKQMFIWSNPAFNTQPARNESVSISKDIASSSSSFSSESSSQQKAASIEGADSEAESKSSEKHDASEENDIDGRQKGAMLPEACVVMNSMQRLSNSKLKLAENVKVEQLNGCNNEHLSDIPLARKILFENNSGNSSQAEEGHIDFPPFTSPATKQTRAGEKCSFPVGDAPGNEEGKLNGGLHEIQQEIERLTERLAELHLQKKKREEEILRRVQERDEKARTSSESRVKEELAGNVEKLKQLEKRAGAGGGVKRTNGTSSSSSSKSAYVRQSPKAQPQKNYGVAREESPLAPAGRRAQGPAVSVSKLSDMRRSVSSTGRRIERSGSDERTKALRRLSLSGAPTSTSEFRPQHQQVLKSAPSKGTPSRVVSSRYGRAITPDACRPSSAASIHQASSKKRDRPSTSAATSPLPAQPQPSPSPSASIACSPLKKAATLRNGYPSRSGFSTPTKDRQLIKPAAMVSSSMQLLPSTLSSSLIKSQDRARLLLSPPRCMSPIPRLDSPKSTAALYKCLESLLEDSRHFFKRLSPARPQRLTQSTQELAIATAAASSSTASISACDRSPKQLLMAMETALPTINTCRLDAMSPRDSGCVKRASDRQKKRFYFANEVECIPEALESS